MAKRQSPKLTRTAEGIGAALGHIAGQLDSWKKQRAELAAEIRKIVESGQRMLSDLGQGAKSARARKGGRPKGYKMPDETRAKLRAAWKRRKAGADAAAAKTTKPTDLRASSRAKDGERFTARQRGKG